MTVSEKPSTTSPQLKIRGMHLEEGRIGGLLYKRCSTGEHTAQRPGKGIRVSPSSPLVVKVQAPHHRRPAPRSRTRDSRPLSGPGLGGKKVHRKTTQFRDLY